MGSGHGVHEELHVLALNFPARGRKREIVRNDDLPNLKVLALNFPARGRKHSESESDVPEEQAFWPLISPQGDGNFENSDPSRAEGLFWPLISPQGDGNQSFLIAEKLFTFVLALNFPARGRKHPPLYFRIPYFPVLALNFPARGRKQRGGQPLWRRKRSFWPLISPQGDGNDLPIIAASPAMGSFGP